MKEEYKDLLLIKNEKDNRFEMKVGEYIAFIKYKQVPGKIILIHTEVSPEMEGKGAATAIIEKTLNYIEQNNLKLKTFCPLVTAYIKRHPEWKKLLDEGVKND
jgi:predicted GNAT family acetyltransferase